MKKTIAMLLATATTLSVGMTAFASDVNVAREAIGEPTVSEGETPAEESSSSDVSSSSSEGSSSEGSSSEGSSSEGSSSEDSTPVGAPKAFAFQTDADTGAILGDTILEPGTEYKFPVHMVDENGKAIVINDALLKDYKFAYSKLSSNGVQKFEIDDYKGVYYLYVTVRESTPLKPVDVKYNLKLVKKADNMTSVQQEVKFQYGYDESNGDYISGLGKGDTVEIDNARPVITGTQFDKIAKINDYKNVTMSGPSWSFTVNVTDESTKNLVSNNAGIKNVLAAFPDQDFKFYNFSGKPTFNSTGRVALDVDDIIDDYSNMYLYRYADGKMYRISPTLNKDENTLEFRTNKLDSFVVTNKLIKDGHVVNDDVLGDTVTKPENGGSSSNGDKENPSTGASDMINLAVMAAIASLGAAGAMTLKKFSK